MSMLDKALQIAAKAHEGQKDRDGEAYILHSLTVGLMGKTDEERMTGFLHDVLEDTDVTSEELLDEGIPESVVNVLQLLTHDKQVPYMDYVQHVIDSHNPIALQVKLNDLTHNYSRGKHYPDLQAKHGKALEVVRKAIEDLYRVTRFDAATLPTGVETAIFAAGCFWGVQHYMARQKGVFATYVGYTGGQEPYPTYDAVRTHKTGHVEAVLVVFDPTIVSYETLAKLFFEIHDPGQTDGQGPDKGAQYLSGCFWQDEAQHATIQSLISLLRDKGHLVNTRVERAQDFWVAEAYHQHYYDNTGGSPYCHFRIRKF